MFHCRLLCSSELPHGERPIMETIRNADQLLSEHVDAAEKKLCLSIDRQEQAWVI